MGVVCWLGFKLVNHRIPRASNRLANAHKRVVASVANTEGLYRVSSGDMMRTTFFTTMLSLYLTINIPSAAHARDCAFLAEMAGFLTRGSLACEFSAEADDTIRQLFADAKRGTVCEPISDSMASKAAQKGISVFSEMQRKTPVYQLCAEAHQALSDVRERIKRK